MRVRLAFRASPKPYQWTMPPDRSTETIKSGARLRVLSLEFRYARSTQQERPFQRSRQRRPGRRGPAEPDVPGPPQGVRLAGNPRGREPRHLRQVLGLCRPRLGDQKSGRLPHPPGRRPPGDLLPRPQGRGPRAVQRLPPSRRAGLPRARGQHPAVPMHLSRLDLQHRRIDQGHPGRRRLSAGLRQAGQGPDAGGAA